jgi:MFS family permease
MWSIPAFLFFFAFLHRVAPGVIVKEIMQAFNASGEIIGLLSAMYFYAYAGFMIPAGLLIDSFGVRSVVAGGSALMGLGTLAMGLAPSEALLMTGRFVVGMGATVTFIGTLKVAANWFPRRTSARCRRSPPLSAWWEHSGEPRPSPVSSCSPAGAEPSPPSPS